MDATLPLDPAAIRDKRRQNPKMRERDFARIHGISEAQLVAAHVGEGVVRLRCDVEAILSDLPSLGEVMALTRNDSAVHEKIGVYEKISVGAQTALVLGEEIDLRIFPPKWKYAFAVEKAGEDGQVLRSLQMFDAFGEAVHKVHLRDGSDLAAFTALVERLRADDQHAPLEPAPIVERRLPNTTTTREELSEAWRAMTDTHQFHGMLRKFDLERLDALHLIERELAWPLQPTELEPAMREAAAGELPIMVFVGNPGCIQIHGGPIRNLQPMGPWLNVMDETFHLHLRLDHITELWAVRKPTADGHVTSIEAYGADRSLIIQFFGLRHEGIDERPEWRTLVEGLAPTEGG